jgi:catechol 2,3-dioxygenase-like lactoylglutathione lyase family enzyme
MIKTEAIDHVCLWVKSLPASKEYYEKVFGFSCIPGPNDDKTLYVESESVHFFISENPEFERFMPNQHLSFEVKSLDAVINSLKELEIDDFEVGEVNFFKNRNYKWCEWRDPDGIRLECIEGI